MAGLNKVVLVGRLATEPEMRYTPSGKPVVSFVLAVDRTHTNAKGEREADFINIIAWQKLAEICSQYLNKGRLVAIDGRLQTRNYEVDGQKRKAYEVVANDMRMLDRGSQSEKLETTGTETKDDKEFIPDGSLEGISPDDLPF
jgi:single-strand DNA-binding protein